MRTYFLIRKFSFQIYWEYSGKLQIGRECI